MKKLLLATALATLPAAISTTAWSKDCGQLPAAFDGPAYTYDGDTIYGAGYAHPIRVWGVQAPELRDQSKSEMVAGMKSRAAVEDMLAAAGHKAHCEPAKFDGYCRVVALCTVGGAEIGLELIKQGLGYSYYLAETKPFGEAKSAAYADAEAVARKARLGLWPVWLGEKPAVEQGRPTP